MNREISKFSFAYQRKSFMHALTGAFFLIRNEPHLQIQLYITFLVIILGWVLNINHMEWALVMLCCGLVIICEAINTAIEKMLDFIHPGQEPRVGLIKDIAAGAVLIAALFSVIIGFIIFLPKMLEFF
jgi:diacylglycerol kinase (ATP)